MVVSLHSNRSGHFGHPLRYQSATTRGLLFIFYIYYRLVMWLVNDTMTWHLIQVKWSWYSVPLRVAQAWSQWNAVGKMKKNARNPHSAITDIYAEPVSSLLHFSIAQGDSCFITSANNKHLLGKLSSSDSLASSEASRIKSPKSWHSTTACSMS